MPGVIQNSPKTVSIFGDSYSFRHNDWSTGVNYSPLSSFGAGSGGDFIVVDLRSWGGMAADDAVNNLGAWADQDALNMGGTFDYVAPFDTAKYQIFRYGINDAIRETIPGIFDFTVAQFKANITSLVNSSQKAARRPMLAVPPTLPVTSLMTQEKVNRLTQMQQAIREVATSKIIPLLDQGTTILLPNEMHDPYHPTPIRMHQINQDLGAKIKITLSTGY